MKLIKKDKLIRRGTWGSSCWWFNLSIKYGLKVYNTTTFANKIDARKHSKKTIAKYSRFLKRLPEHLHPHLPALTGMYPASFGHKGRYTRGSRYTPVTKVNEKWTFYPAIIMTRYQPFGRALTRPERMKLNKKFKDEGILLHGDCFGPRHLGKNEKGEPVILDIVVVQDAEEYL